MENLFFARYQMGMSLAFHILFASVGITMPLLMVLAERAYQKTQDPEYLKLAKSWAKGTAVFFAVGAVSGTVLAFELGLLFPMFMEKAGATIGLPFALEGFAFFTEAIFLGIYLYGWDRVSPRLHIFSGIVVAVSGMLSAIFVTTANAWMNTPTGFGDPIGAMMSPFTLHEIPHTLASSYVTTAFVVAAIHAWVLLYNPKSSFHQKALKLALLVGIPCALAQPLIGHFAGEQVAHYQPLKLAAMERQMKTQASAPLSILGLFEIPKGLSLLATGDPNATVQGLEEFPEADWPSVWVRVCFQAMVLTGMLLVAISLWGIWRWKTLPQRRYLLGALILAAPLGIVATEAGWMVTEMGRQPWTIYGILRTSESASPVPNLWIPALGFSLIYLVLGLSVGLILWRHVKLSPGFQS